MEKSVLDLKNYKNLKNHRIAGFKKLEKVGLRYPSPLKMVPHNTFLQFKKERKLNSKAKKELKNAFNVLMKEHKDKGIIARRAYLVPGIENPPGPHSAKITKFGQLVKEIEAIFDFAIDNGFDRKGSEITAFFHPLINPVFPQVGGCVTPSKDNPREVVIEAIYGMDEAVQSFPHDTYIVNIKKDNIVGKYIQNKTKCLQFTEDFKVETISIPAKFQNAQVISDFKVLTIAKEFEKVLKAYGPSRVEFDILDDEVYFIELTPFVVKKAKKKEIDSKGRIFLVKDVTDLEKVTENNKIIFVDPEVIEKRKWDILMTLAYNLVSGSFVLFPGTVTTAHAATVFREMGHNLVFVRNERFKSQELVRIRLKGNHLVAEKQESEDIPDLMLLKEVDDKTKSFVGNKAFRLAELVKNKFDVPDAYVVTTNVFDRFLKENKLTPLVNKLDLEKSKDELVKLANKLHKKILNGTISNNIKRQIHNKFNKMNFKRIAVRSSATCEDIARASFAGQFNTVLDVGKRSLIRKMKEIWASMFTKNVVIYSLSNHIPLNSIKMAVIIMEMIDADKAGVMFTKDINSGNMNVVTIEGAPGLGDKVVDGLIEPDRVIVNKDKGKIKRRTRKKILTDSEIRKLVNQAKKIERFYEKPQDIEWAIKDKKVWILQTRPITT